MKICYQKNINMLSKKYKYNNNTNNNAYYSNHFLIIYGVTYVDNHVSY